MDPWQTTLFVLLALLFINYLLIKTLFSSSIPTEIGDSKEAFETREGFAGGVAVDGADEYANDTLYDKFYCKIYDQIVQGDVRIRAEMLFTMAWIKKYWPENRALHILDVGCGTGGHVAEFTKEKVGSVTGIDNSSAMIERARKLNPNLEFKIGNTEQPTTYAAGQFSLITMYYFTIYYIHHKDQILRNLFNWLKPGGGFVVHLVNRDKFDPILEAASPFLAFSVQKYAKKRVTKSKVSFDKFDYTAEFNLQDNHAEFNETFVFKDGKVRRNKHDLLMPTMESIVREIEAAGFTYKEYVDLTPIGYEYQYLFCFVR
jgi:SAM-dependent methyltransferase